MGFAEFVLFLLFFGSLIIVLEELAIWGKWVRVQALLPPPASSIMAVAAPLAFWPAQSLLELVSQLTC